MSKEQVQDLSRFGQAAKIFQVLEQGKAVAIQPSPFNIVYNGKDGWKVLDGFHRLDVQSKVYLLELVIGAQDHMIKAYLKKLEPVEKKRKLREDMQLQLEAAQEVQRQASGGLVQARGVPQLG